MNTYRIQARLNGMYLSGTCQGESINEAGKDFMNKISNGEIKPQPERFYQKDKVFVTYEEINGDTTVAITPVKKDALGIKVESTLS